MAGVDEMSTMDDRSLTDDEKLFTGVLLLNAKC
jgi:hypothetical protein